jgi:hypothetical protein
MTAAQQFVQSVAQFAEHAQEVATQIGKRTDPTPIPLCPTQLPMQMPTHPEIIRDT